MAKFRNGVRCVCGRYAVSRDYSYCTAKKCQGDHEVIKCKMRTGSAVCGFKTWEFDSPCRDGEEIYRD